jgi:hypothetical protein
MPLVGIEAAHAFANPAFGLPKRREFAGGRICAPHGLPASLRDGAFVHLVVTNIAIIAIGWGVPSWVVPPYASEIGIGPQLIGLLLLANATTVVVAQVPVAKIAEGRRRVIAVSSNTSRKERMVSRRSVGRSRNSTPTCSSVATAFLS